MWWSELHTDGRTRADVVRSSTSGVADRATLQRGMVRAMAFGYPVFLDLGGVEVLVVGGGPVALRKAIGVAEAGARVTVVAPELVAGFEAITDRIEQRPYATGEAAARCGR